MNPAQQEEQRLQERFDVAEKEIELALTKMLKKDIHFLTDTDKAFLRARRSMLDDRQLEKYESILNEKASKAKDDEDEKVIEEMTRRELEAMATTLGIEEPDNKKLYRTNADLQAAIKAKQEENES